MTRILRASGTPRARPRRVSPEATRVLRADQVRALGEAAETLEAAGRQARALLDQAAADAEELRRQAEADSRTKAALLLCRAEQRAAQIALEARAELTTLAVRIAEKILGEQLRLQPQSVCAIVEQCLRACPDARRVRLRAHPEDLPLLESALPRLGGQGVAALQLVADDQVSRGGCVLDSELGEVDGRLEVQLRRLAEALR